MYSSGGIKTGKWLFLLILLLGFQSKLLYAVGDSLDFPGNWETYPSHNQYLNFIHDLAATYTDICRLDTIGHSVAGRPIIVMKITDNPDAHEPDPAFYYTSTMHGDETSGFMLLLRLIDHICRNYGQDSLSTRLVDNIEIWINPLANPDGTYGSNDSVISNPTRENLNGEDLNRNFPSPVGGVVDYEPETQAQMQFMKSIHLVLAANIHDGEEVFNYPWDTWAGLHADNNWYIQAGRKYADTVQKRAVPELYMSGFDDGISNGYQWYDIIGGRQDYVNYFLHAREVTLELSRYTHPSADYLPFLWQYNYTALLRYMENSLFGIQGRITDAVTGQPVKATIKVTGHDKDNSHVFSDSISGYFARLIEAGSWSLEFTAEGYEIKTIPGVLVEWDRSTDLLVQMDPIAEGSNPISQLEVWPNPWIRETSIRFHVIVPGLRRIILAGIDGKILMSDNIACPTPGSYKYELNSHGIEPGWYVLQLLSPEGIISVKILRSE